MPLLTYEQALNAVLSNAHPLDVVQLPLSDASGLRLASDVTSRVNLPRFNNSQMDGYAVRSGDLERASQLLPLVLPVQSTLAAGEREQTQLDVGKAIRIFTGAPIPAGADTVVPVEDVKFDSEVGTVTFLEPVQRGQFVRLLAEDVKVNDLLLASGTLLNSSTLALLASTGFAATTVYRQPRVVVLTNGDELVRAEKDFQYLVGGQIYECNSLLLSNLVTEAGASVVGVYGTTDSRSSLLEQLQNIILTIAPDLILSTGGVSVGDRDFVRSVVEELGKIVFWRAAIRPGKPIVYGTIKSSHFLGLPGNPASTRVTFELFAKPLLSKLQGGTGEVKLWPTKIEQSIEHETGRRSFVRANTSLSATGLRSTPLLGQGSHYVTSLAKSNSLIVLPEDIEKIETGADGICILLDNFLND